VVTLRSLQIQIRRFITHGDRCDLIDEIDGNAATAEQRLGIFRNNSLVAHTTVLSAVFPVVRRLVDTRFFAFMAHAFISETPPQHPCLSEYGKDFPDFVACFSPASHIRYLSDVARLEWAISRVPVMSVPQAIPIARLAAYFGDPADARLTIDPAVSFIESDYPIDILWELHRSEDIIEQTVLEARGAYLQVHGGASPPFRALDKADWMFRRLAAAGATLGVITEAALEVAPDFDLAKALTALFSEGLVLDCR
jgi:Putative DNA-binding domain